MNFSQTVKKEILQRESTAPCCINATCYGIACFSKYFDSRGVVLHTERAYIAQWAKKMFSLAGIKGTVYGKGENNKRNYEFNISNPFEVEKMLALFGHTGEETAVRLHFENLICDKCFAGFISAAFLCCGTVVDPEKGYMLEFVHSRYQLVSDLEELLKQKGFAPGRTTRKGANILYFKSSEQIEDLLTYMGATRSSLEIMHTKVYKDFRNRANRITNCETANIDKQVLANQKVLKAIYQLESKGLYSNLPETLKKAADLRKKHPDISLADLAALTAGEVSKSGLSHRFKKICDLADAAEETAPR